MMRTTGMQLLIVGMFLVSSQTADASVLLTYVEGVWMDPMGGAPGCVNYVYDVITGYGNGRQDQIFWGNPDNISSQSGLGFTGVASPARLVDVGTPFDLFQLTHINRPVDVATSCDSLQLVVVLGFENGSPAALQFTFNVDETLNEPGPPYSNDIIAFTGSGSSQDVSVNGETYTLRVLGFGPDCYNLQSSLETKEGCLNSSLFWATLVPEPATLFLLGLGGLAVLRRRRAA